MTIAALEELRAEFGEEFCGQVVCAGGLKHQWRDAISQFTGGVEDDNGVWTGGSSCIVIDGPPAKRMELYERVLAEQPQYVIVGYDQVIDDNNMVSQLPQMFVVADEVTTIKSPGALITEAFRETFGEAPFRYGLTGTPMENGKPEEMFQLMVWIDDTVLGRADLFDKTFVKRNKWGGVKEYINLPLFFEMMQECSVSIDADDPGVREYMPTLSRTRRVLVQLDEESARVYRVMAGDLMDDLAEAKKMARGSSFDLFAHYSGDSAAGEVQGKIMSKISCIRMLCSHPDVLIRSGEDYLAQVELRERMDEEHEAHVERFGAHDVEDCPLPVPPHKHSNAPSHKCPKKPCPRGWPKITVERKGKKVLQPKPYDGSAYAAELLDVGEFDALDETPKLDEVCLDIDEVLKGECSCCVDMEDGAGRSKVVIFSYHKLVLRILEQRYGPAVSVRYDGDMSLKLRNENKKRFQRDPATRLFLTSDAGGYGVDLPQANHLFNLDKPFTAGRVTQRNARVRRANLDFHTAVHVRDYLIDGSLELYYASATDAKQKVAHAVRTGRGTVAGGLKMNANTLGAFLAENEV